MFTRKQLAQLFKVSGTLIDTWVKQGYFPTPDSPLRTRSWKTETVRKFIREKNVRICHV